MKGILYTEYKRVILILIITAIASVGSIILGFWLQEKLYEIAIKI